MNCYTPSLNSLENTVPNVYVQDYYSLTPLLSAAINSFPGFQSPPSPGIIWGENKRDVGSLEGVGAAWIMKYDQMPCGDIPPCQLKLTDVLI